jgi:transcriptional regulator with XRE-family HTH domain
VLGQKLRKARQTAGLSQEELGFRAKVSRNYVSMVELGQASPTLDTLIRLCHALDVKAASIVAGVEREMQQKQPSARSRR